jgi:hypothetical protein
VAATDIIHAQYQSVSWISCTVALAAGKALQLKLNLAACRFFLKGISFSAAQQRALKLKKAQL